MGASPYWYFVPYDPEPGRALEALRSREFEAGRYSDGLDHLKFDDPAFLSARPGARHATIEQAIEDSGDSGTQSILDIVDVGPSPDFSVAGPLDGRDLEDALGTREPTREVLAARKARLWTFLERGQCAYVVVYSGGRPTELLFAGYSYD